MPSHLKFGLTSSVNFTIKLVVFVQLFWRVRTLSFR